MAGLAAVGFAVAAYLAVTKLAGGSALFCRAVGGCEVAQPSRYAVFLGLPTAAWGASLYAAVGGLALSGLGARRWLAGFLLAVAGVAFSAYLTYLELFVIGAVCWYCVVSAATAAALLGVLLGGRRSVTGPRRFLRPGRVVGLGAATACLHCGAPSSGSSAAISIAQSVIANCTRAARPGSPGRSRAWNWIGSSRRPGSD